MATGDASHDAGSRRASTSVRAAVVLLSIYVAMYAAVWGVVRVLSTTGPAAIAPESSVASAAAAATSTSQPGVSEPSPSDSPGQVLQRTDGSGNRGSNAETE
jgi:hypothetical protein